MTATTAILIVKLGDTLPHMAADLGDFEHWIAQGLQADNAPVHIEVADPRPGAGLPHPALPAPATVAQRRMGVVVTGSHAMVTDRAPWSEATATWLAELVAQGVPVLGICYGHQLLAHALGGEVWAHPIGLEAGTIQVEPTAHAATDPLLGHLSAPFAAQSAHRQSVRVLPPGATVLARNAFEPHHAYRVGTCAWGVQFHPEFGPEATRGYVQHLANDLHAQGDNVQALHANVRPSPEAASVLARFARLVADQAHLVDLPDQAAQP
jgi:GMP synthase (glutamine-hydrolysing)